MFGEEAFVIGCYLFVCLSGSQAHNVKPGLINPWLINRVVPPFSGDSSVLEGTPP